MRRRRSRLSVAILAQGPRGPNRAPRGAGGPAPARQQQTGDGGVRELDQGRWLRGAAHDRATQVLQARQAQNLRDFCAWAAQRRRLDALEASCHAACHTKNEYDEYDKYDAKDDASHEEHDLPVDCMARCGAEHANEKCYTRALRVKVLYESTVRRRTIYSTSS